MAQLAELQPSLVVSHSPEALLNFRAAQLILLDLLYMEMLFAP